MPESVYKKNAHMRYHLSRELDQHRTRMEEDRKANAIDYVVPVFSATFTIIASILIKDSFFHQIAAGWPLGRIIVVCLLGIPLSFFIIYKLTRTVLSVSKGMARILRNLGICSDNQAARQLDDSLAKELANKFNYEIVNLAYLSYNLAKNGTEDSVIQKYRFMESLFYISTAIRKMDHIFTTTNSAIPSDELKPFRVIGTMDMMAQALEILKSHTLYEDFDHEIVHLVTSYNALLIPINRLYNLQLSRVFT